MPELLLGSRQLRLLLEGKFVRVWPRLLVPVAACLLLWVAWFNGYPTVFSDTGGYLWTGKYFAALPPFRAPGYAIFTRIMTLGGTAWFVVVAQAAIVVYVLREVCNHLMEGDLKSRNRLFLATVCILATLTSLPWIVSLVMPDVFAGVLFLAMFLLSFANELSTARRMCLAAILALAAASHSSLLPIAFAFAVAVVLAKLVGWQRSAAVPPVRAALAWLLAPLMAAGICTASLNSAMGIGFRVSPSGNTFLLARLFSDGLAADYLHENCSNTPLISCRYLSDLPQTQEQFLFQHPLIQALYGHEDEIAKIVKGAILAHPFRFASSSARDAFTLFSSFRTGDEVRTYGAREWNSGVLEEVLPNDFQAFSNSRESRGVLLPLADSAARIDGIAFWMSAAICLWALASGRFGRANEFFYAAVVFLVINAAICATFAGVYERYQGRVAWIIPFCLIAYAGCLARARRSVAPAPALKPIEFQPGAAGLPLSEGAFEQE